MKIVGEGYSNIGVTMATQKEMNCSFSFKRATTKRVGTTFMLKFMSI